MLIKGEIKYSDPLICLDLQKQAQSGALSMVRKSGLMGRNLLKLKPMQRVQLLSLL
jgi:hypothetical protein